MSSRPPTRVPTLTEVVSLPDSGAPATAGAPADAPVAPALAGAPIVTPALERRSEDRPLPSSPPSSMPPVAAAAASADPSGPAPSLAAPTALPPDELVERVLADLQRQIDLMLEVRMREVLSTVLTRATDAVVRDARAELASTLRDLVSRAVAQEKQRHRDS